MSESDVYKATAELVDKFSPQFRAFLNGLRDIQKGANEASKATTRSFDDVARGIRSVVTNITTGLQPSFASLGLSTLALTGGLAGLALAMKNFATNTVAIQWAGKEAGMSVNQVRFLEQAFGRLQVPVEQTRQSLRGFADVMLEMRRGGGPGFVYLASQPVFHQMLQDLRTTRTNTEALDVVLRNLSDNPWFAQGPDRERMLRAFNLPVELSGLYGQNLTAFMKEVQSSFHEMSQAEIDDASRGYLAIIRLRDSFDRLGNAIAARALPSFTRLSDALTKWMHEGGIGTLIKGFDGLTVAMLGLGSYTVLASITRVVTTIAPLIAFFGSPAGLALLAVMGYAGVAAYTSQTPQRAPQPGEAPRAGPGAGTGMPIAGHWLFGMLNMWNRFKGSSSAQWPMTNSGVGWSPGFEQTQTKKDLTDAVEEGTKKGNESWWEWFKTWFSMSANAATLPGAEATREALGYGAGGGGSVTFRRGIKSPATFEGPGGNIAVGPTEAGPTTDAGLAADRKRFAEELKQKPWLAAKIAAISLGENRNPKANVSVIESMMNRASARGTSLEEAAKLYGHEQGGYYAGYAPGALRDARLRALTESSIAQALGGSNVSNYATDNSSGGLAARERATGSFTFQSTYGGESFFSPGYSGSGRASRSSYLAWRKRIDEQRSAAAVQQQSGASTFAERFGAWPKYQHGGIVERPTLAMVGEGGPEMILPIKKFAQMALPWINGEKSIGGDLLGMNRYAWHRKMMSFLANEDVNWAMSLAAPYGGRGSLGLLGGMALDAASGLYNTYNMIRNNPESRLRIDLNGFPWWTRTTTDHTGMFSDVQINRGRTGTPADMGNRFASP